MRCCLRTTCSFSVNSHDQMKLLKYSKFSKPANGTRTYSANQNRHALNTSLFFGSHQTPIVMVSHKKWDFAFGNNFAKCWPIFKILSLLEIGWNLQQKMYKIIHHTYNVLILELYGIVIWSIWPNNELLRLLFGQIQTKYEQLLSLEYTPWELSAVYSM